MNLIWFRNDLRVQANPAVAAASGQNQPALAVVCLTPQSWSEHDESPRRMGLWRARLIELEQELQRLNIALKVLQLNHFSDCPEALSSLCREKGIERLFFNYEYPLNEQLRDQAVITALQETGIGVERFHGEVIIPPGEVKTGQGTDFKVYTPFSRAWRRRLGEFDLPIQSIKTPLPSTAERSDPIPQDLGWRTLEHDPQRWPADSDSIRRQVYHFIEVAEVRYAEDRDFPAIEGTSKLSPYLTIGAISPLQLMHVQRSHYSDDSWLQSSWLNEIIWREFYRHLIVAFPQQSRLLPFRPETEQRITWLRDDEGFSAWCRGETGFPIVDAAMKQLLATGWMHNRLRMIVASFLTKLLGVDWRDGERFFMSQLIDADFPSNLGGWQWSASVGADAAPYFRIFNPTAQSEKFDPQGEFLLTWLPELARVPVKQRHRPGAGAEYGRPRPIIDYAAARKRALDSYNSAG